MERSEIESLRSDYSSQGIDLESLPATPEPFFNQWFEDAMAANIQDPNAMVIATATPSGQLRQRSVLMKSFDENGFCFYTNFTSRKAMHLELNPAISCLFPWLVLHRQVSIRGTVTKVPADQSKAYFHSRPRDSQIGAWASRQSAELSGRSELAERFSELEQRFQNREVPYPEFWGGFQITPTEFEFWQGRNSRLHDRVVFSREKPDSTNWVIKLLNP